MWRSGFLFDETQANIDAALHFGVDPWRFVRFILDWQPLLRAVEFNYDVIWFVLSFAILYFFASSPKAAAARNRYLVTFMLVWIIVGNVFAGLFMSAGPAFYGNVTGDFSRFSELLSLLAAGHNEASDGIDYKAYLWHLHENGQAGFASGISAFPSVHVGLTVMNTLFAYEANRVLGHLMAFYALLIAVSSVALAWHYAIDGYAAAIIVCAIYFAVKHAAVRMNAPASIKLPTATAKAS